MPTITAHSPSLPSIEALYARCNAIVASSTNLTASGLKVLYQERYGASLDDRLSAARATDKRLQRRYLDDENLSAHFVAAVMAGRDFH